MCKLQNSISFQTAIKMDHAVENHLNGHSPSNETDATVCLASDSSNADGSVSVNGAVLK